VANKIDLADRAAIQLFEQWANDCKPNKELIASTQQGQLDAAWLDMPRNPQRQASFPNADQSPHHSSIDNAHTQLANEADGYQSYGYIFPAQRCFDFEPLSKIFIELNVERIKGVINTSQGWFIVNGADTSIDYVPITPSINSRIEIITRDNYSQDLLARLETLLDG
jgi:G3E family GTPase